MAVMSINVDAREKEIFSSICADLGMNISTAVNVFIKAVNRTRGIPFNLTTVAPSKKKPLTPENVSEMLSLSAPDDFKESPASIELLREITKDDVW